MLGCKTWLSNSSAETNSAKSINSLDLNTAALANLRRARSRVSSEIGEGLIPL